MQLRICLALLLVATLPGAAFAQSIYRGSLPSTSSTTSPPRDAGAVPAIPAPPDRQQPPAAPPAAPPQPPAPAAPAVGTPPAPKPVDHAKKPRPAAPMPPGSVIAPPGSIILPPASVVPPRGRDTDKRRIHAVTHCNQQQITCNDTCNARSRGTMRTICYRQCTSRYLDCVNRANTQP